MKSLANLLAAAVLVVFSATQANAQSQTTPNSSAAAAATTTPKVQAPAATPADTSTNSNATAATPNTTAPKAARKSTLSRKSRRIPPPPALSSIRHSRSTRKDVHGATAAAPTELDPFGRVDSAGKTVPFYPSTRGNNPTSKNTTSAYRTGKRQKAPKSSGS